MQFTLDDFTTLEEARLWVEEKANGCAKIDKPAKICESNWVLSEYYVEHDGGIKKKRKAEAEDTLSRVASDLNSGMAILGHAEQGKQKKVISVEEKFKSATEKVKRAERRLGKLLSTCEVRLPTMKRQMVEEQYANVRAGVGRCRDCREMCLDTLEDCKALPQEEALQGICFETLSKLTADLTEHADCLQSFLAPSAEASAAAAEAAIKNEDASASALEAVPADLAS